MTDQEYFAVKAASYSTLKHGLKSMAHLKFALNNTIEPTEAMKLGTLVHAAVLEPDSLFTNYEVAPCDNRALKAYKEWVQTVPTGKLPVRPKDMELALAMRDAVYKKPRLKALLQLEGIVERPVFWRDSVYGFDCKCKPDKLIPQAGIILDLKTCLDASEDAFQKTIVNYGYHLQALHYLTGLEGTPYKQFVILAVEKSAPYECAAYEIGEEWLEAARIQWNTVLEKYAKATKENKWQGYPDKIIESLPPRWMNTQTDA
jgi:hypothetical protein